MKCFNCGAELTDDTKFCSYCGAQISEQPTDNGESIEENSINPNTIPEQEKSEEPTPVKGVKKKNSEKTSIADNIKKKLKDFWSRLSIFGKLSTVSIALSVLLGLIAFVAGRIFSGIIAVVWLAVVAIAMLMKKNIIKVPKTWIPILAIILSFVLIVPYVGLFKLNIADYEKYSWTEVALADKLPKPESPYGELISNSESYLVLYVNKANEEQFNQYIEECKEKGYTIDAEATDSLFCAYNETGYKLSINYFDYNNEMHISLEEGKALTEFSWSNSNMAQMLPLPESNIGEIQQDDEHGFVAYVGETSIDVFNTYIQACESKGFTVDADKTDKRFSAKNTEKYELTVEYQGNNIIYISLDEPKYEVEIVIECVENLIFSKYDVDVYVDDSFEGTITHGKSETFDLTLKKGTYVLKFVNAEDDEVDGKVTLYIGKDENLKYKVSCTSSEISVDTIAGTTKPKDDNTNQKTNISLDYSDAKTFEDALNSGKTVYGKTVQFVVNDYKPDSALGINCWAGEHLNFISDTELDVSAGDVIIGKVTDVPSKVLGSWKIPYEVLTISEGEAVSKTQKNGFNPSKNELYTLPGYTVEIPEYWKSENKIDSGIQRYAETGGKVAMLQVSAQSESDENYSVTFDGLMDDNDNMIAMIESTAFKEVTNYEVIDTGFVKGILYTGTIENSGLTGQGQWFMFASEKERYWCSLIMCETDNTELSYTEDFMKTIESIKPIDNETVEAEPIEPEPDETETTPTNKAGAPDDWTNLLEKHFEEVEKQFKDAGFTNITCVAHEIDYNENYVFEGSVVNIAIGENGDICTFEKGEQWDKEIKIRIDYRVKPAKPASEYEKAYIRDMSNYDLYYMFDTDTKTVVYFGTNDTYIEKGTYTGDFTTGVTINWSHGEWTEKFTHKSGNYATMIDGNGWDWEYKVCDVEKAQNVLDGLK